jgi:hypothetical protein
VSCGFEQSVRLAQVCRAKPIIVAHQNVNRLRRGCHEHGGAGGEESREAHYDFIEHTDEQSNRWRSIVAKQQKTPNTWETAGFLSSRKGSHSLTGTDTACRPGGINPTDPLNPPS